MYFTTEVREGEMHLSINNLGVALHWCTLKWTTMVVRLKNVLQHLDAKVHAGISNYRTRDRFTYKYVSQFNKFDKLITSPPSFP